MTMKTRICGAVHATGVICSIPIYYEEGTCKNKACENSNQRLYPHEEPHERVDPKTGVITHRWEEIVQCKDLEYDCYAPIEHNLEA